METPIKMDDLGVPLFTETSIYTLRIQKCPKKEISLAILFWGGDSDHRSGGGLDTRDTIR